ncbi:serine/threonine-protein kinase [Ascidiaceihabitans sp.]|uniref:serine/threonine-protein kinase n=1 Tax=Ascidiaceihabitans sp. TaxID=1872644 RepID=UPI00329A3068
MSGPDNTAPPPEDDDDKTRIAGINTPLPVPPVPAPTPPAANPAEDAPQDPKQPAQVAAGDAETQAPASEPASEETPADSEADAIIGAVINNNYKVQQLISAGGMGEVYRGEHIYTGDPVAIKIVLPSLSKDEKVLTLFKREARILSQLADEAIVRYFNFIPDPELGRYCLIMDFIDGVPLSDMVAKSGPISLDQSLRLLVRLAKGLDKAHAREVTHRDLSPDNVMLPEGNVDNAVLIDFGIAKSTEMTEGTLHGQLAGKFKYISPEQLGHFDSVISPRTDIYGLGLLIAAAVRGTPIDMGSSVVEAVNARRTIPDLSDIYPELQPLLAHMLEPDPQFRPARMSDVAAMVEGSQAIPARYTGAAPLPGGGGDMDQTMIAGSMPPGTMAPGTMTPGTMAPQQTAAPIQTGGFGAQTGLQQPPGSTQHTSFPQTQAPMTQTGIGIGAGDVSQSPFGASSTEVPFSQTIPPQQTMAPTTADAPKSKTGLIAAVLALVVAGAGIGAWQSGMFDSAEVVETATEPTETETAAAAMPAPDADTRQGFLAGYNAGSACTFATRITSGENSGKLEVFAASEGALAQLPQAYGEKFGAEPATVNRQINDSQCAALDFARALQGREAVEPVVTLDTDAVLSGGTVLGRVRDVRGRTVWLSIVSAAGGVYNLSPRLQAQPDGSQTFEFGMSLGEGSEAAPQMLIALASNDPLLTLAAIKDGDDVQKVMPLLLQEIAKNGGTAAAGTGFFELQPN